MSTVFDFPPIDATAVKSYPAEAPASTEPATDRAEIKDGNVLVQYSATEAGLAALRTDLAGKTYDLKTTKGDQAARADRLRCVTLRTTLEKKRKEFKAPALLFGEKIDAEAKRITAEIKALETPIDAQIVADEQRRAAEKAERERLEAERVAKHRAGIERIRGYAVQAQGKTFTQIEADIAVVSALTFHDEWEEFITDAVNARDLALAELRALRETQRQRELEAARIEAQRVEQARVAAEQAERQRQLDEQAAALKRRAEDLAAAQTAQEDAAKALRQTAAPVPALVAPPDPVLSEKAVADANAIAFIDRITTPGDMPDAPVAAAPDIVILDADIRYVDVGLAPASVTTYLPASTAAVPLPGPFTQTTLRQDDGDDGHAEDLYARLESLSKLLDERDFPDARRTILDAMNFVRACCSTSVNQVGE